MDQIPKIEVLFELFLDEVVALSDMTKIITWEKISPIYDQQDSWIETVWRKLVNEGLAYYKNEVERNSVMLRFIALTDFYAEFMSGFSREYYSESGPQDIAKEFDLPMEVLDNLCEDYAVRHGHDSNEEETIHKALNEIVIEHIYPALIDYYGDTENLAFSIYRAAYPTYFDEDPNEFLSDPEDSDVDEKAQLIALEKINRWLACTFGSLGV